MHTPFTYRYLFRSCKQLCTPHSHTGTGLGYLLWIFFSSDVVRSLCKFMSKLGFDIILHTIFYAPRRQPCINFCFRCTGLKTHPLLGFLLYLALFSSCVLVTLIGIVNPLNFVFKEKPFLKSKRFFYRINPFSRS